MLWRSGDYRAVRTGDWKLQLTKRPEKARLYNLAADPTERHDLAARDPRRVAELGATIEAQNKGMAKPNWPGLVEGPVRMAEPLTAPWHAGQDYTYWPNCNRRASDRPPRAARACLRADRLSVYR